MYVCVLSQGACCNHRYMAIETNISVCGHAAFTLYMTEGHIKIKWTLLGLKKKLAAQYNHDCVV